MYWGVLTKLIKSIVLVFVSLLYKSLIKHFKLTHLRYMPAVPDYYTHIYKVQNVAPLTDTFWN